MLPQEFLYQLKAANPIEQVMGGYVRLVRSGTTLKCQCPFHSEKTPSCVVYANTQDPHFYCFGCHTGGDVITFLMKIENIGYMDAVQMLAERAGLQVPKEQRDNGEARRRMRLLELNRDAARYYFSQLTGSDKRGLVYLRDRQLSAETVKKFGLGYAGDGWEGLTRAMQQKGYTEDELITANLCIRSDKNGRLRDRFRSRVMFPIMDQRGSVIAFGGRTLLPDGKPKYLNSSDTPVYNKRRTLYAINHAAKSQSKRVILAEGYMDVISIYQAGFHNVIASLGTALTVEQCRLLQQHGFEEIVIAYDSDFAGQDATMRSLKAIRQVGLRAFRLLVQDAKDPDEYIKKFGAGRFRMLLEEAPDAIEFALSRAKASADPKSEGSTVAALEQAVLVLSEIENDLEREVYLSKTAAEYDIPKDVLKEQVSKEIRRRAKSQKKQEWHSLTAAPALPDPVVPDAVGKRREYKAEEQILAYLFRFPDALPKVRSLIAPEDFITDLHRRIYTHLAGKLDEGYPFSISLFSGAFTPDEMGKITGIQAEYREIAFTEKSLTDAAAVLRDSKETAKDAAALDEEDFSAFFDRLRQKKNTP